MSTQKKQPKKWQLVFLAVIFLGGIVAGIANCVSWWEARSVEQHVNEQRQLTDNAITYLIKDFKLAETHYLEFIREIERAQIKPTYKIHEESEQTEIMLQAYVEKIKQQTQSRLTQIDNASVKSDIAAAMEILTAITHDKYLAVKTLRATLNKPEEMAAVADKYNQHFLAQHKQIAKAKAHITAAKKTAGLPQAVAELN